MMTIGQKIRSLRTFRGWSQEVLGEIVGVHQRTICSWELGDTAKMPLGKFYKICEAFDVTPSEIMEGVEL